MATSIDALEELPTLRTRRQQSAEQAVVDDLTDGSASIVVKRVDGSEHPLDDDDLRAFLAVLMARARGQRVFVVAHESLISPQKAATLLGVSRPMIYRYIESGDLNATRVGSHWRIRAGHVLALAEKRSRQATAINHGIAVALDTGSGRPVDARRAWREATQAERAFARELIADVLAPDADQ